MHPQLDTINNEAIIPEPTQEFFKLPYKCIHFEYIAIIFTQIFLDILRPGQISIEILALVLELDHGPDL